MDLYINGQKADLSQDLNLQMTYAASDLTSPAAVKNSFSQQVTLPATATNDAIFGAIFRTDHRTMLSSDQTAKFNPLIRTPFAIYDSTGQIVESGYLKLNTITNKNGVRGYTVTLYGGLGSFFYTLSYDDKGEALSLGDLPLVSADPDDKTDYTINAETVADAWARLKGSTSKPAKFDAVNFAPAYNGLPDGKFAADKAIGVPQQIGGKYEKDGYETHNGYALYDLGEEFTEWQTKDLRSYLQRPVVSVRALFAAMTRYAAARGFDMDLDLAWFNDRNPYFAKAWMTLPLLSTRTVPQEKGNINLAGNAWTDKVAAWTFITPVHIPLTPDLTTSNTQVTVRCRVCPTIRPEDPKAVGWSAPIRWCGVTDANPEQYLGAVAFAQLQLLDAAGNVLNYSPVQVYTSFPDQTAAIWMERIETAMADLKDYHNAMPDIANDKLTLTPDLETGEPYWSLASENAPMLEASSTNVKRAQIVLYFRMCHKKNVEGQFQYWAYVPNDTSLFLNTDTAIPKPVFLKEWGARVVDATLEYETQESYRSGATITQAALFADTMSPMKFLLSYTKTFGLHYLYDSARRRVQIVSRNTLYGNRPTVNIEERIDRAKEIKTTPIPMSAKWLSFAPGSADGEFVEYYKNKYGREYGTQKVNTGYDFDANTTDVLKDADFNGGAEVRELSKYFNNVTSGTHALKTPSPFLNGKASYTLYKGGRVDDDTLELEGLTPTANDAVVPYVKGLAGYDMIPKLQCHGADNSPTDGGGILLLHRGSIADVEGAAEAYKRFRITDDINEMYAMNDDTPCWNFSGSILATDMPIFGRFEMQGDKIVRTLDLGLPAEIDMPLVTAGEDTTVYERCWAAYIADRYNVDTRVCTAYVNLRGMTPGPEMLRNFYYFDGAVWVLNKISNYTLTSPGTTQCEFVKVQQTAAYAAGQLINASTELTIQLSTNGTDLFLTTSRPLQRSEFVGLLTHGKGRIRFQHSNNGSYNHINSGHKWRLPQNNLSVTESGKIVLPASTSTMNCRWRLEKGRKGGMYVHIAKANHSKHFGYKVDGDMDKAVTFAVAVVRKGGTATGPAVVQVSNRCYFQSRCHIRSGELTQEFVLAE